VQQLGWPDVNGLVLVGKTSPKTMNFTMKYGGFRFQFSLKPIQWNPMDMDKPHME
jgi:hypothetical protein